MKLRTQFFVFALVSFMLVGTSFSAMAAEKIGVVGSVNGNVTATGTEGAARSLKAGSPVYLNDVIVSDASSKAQIMFLDKSALMVNAGTKVTVDRFVYDPASASGDLSITSAKGALRFIGGALSKKKPVKIKTPVATIGIRGGIADAHVGAGGKTETVFVFGDELTMTNGRGQTQRLTTPGQGLTLAKPTDVPRPLPPARTAQLMGSFGGDVGGGDDQGNAPDGQNDDNAGPGATNNDDGQGGNSEGGDDNAAGGPGSHEEGGEHAQGGEEGQNGDGRKPEAKRGEPRGPNARDPRRRGPHHARNGHDGGDPRGPEPESVTVNEEGETVVTMDSKEFAKMEAEMESGRMDDAPEPTSVEFTEDGKVIMTFDEGSFDSMDGHDGGHDGGHYGDTAGGWDNDGGRHNGGHDGGYAGGYGGRDGGHHDGSYGGHNGGHHDGGYGGRDGGYAGGYGGHDGGHHDGGYGGRDGGYAGGYGRHDGGHHDGGYGGYDGGYGGHDGGHHDGGYAGGWGDGGYHDDGYGGHHDPGHHNGGITNTNLNGGVDTGAIDPGTNTAAQDGNRGDSSNTLADAPINVTHSGMYALGSGVAAPTSAGRSEFEQTGDRFNGRFVQGFPNPVAGPGRAASLPWLNQNGFQDVTDATIDGVTTGGHGYRTTDQAMFYYDLDHNGERLNTVVGRMAPAHTWDASAARSAVDGPNARSGLAFYNFLPDVAGFEDDAPNFFDYNITDDRLVNTPSVTRNAGLVVDWNKERFITGRLDWNTDPAVSVQRSMVLAFGKTNHDGRLLDGRTFEFVRNDFDTVMPLHSKGGYLRTLDAYSPVDGERFSGMILEGVQPDDHYLDKFQAFDPYVNGPRSFQPIVHGDINQDVLDSQSNSTGVVRRGFAAGFISTHVSPGSVPAYQRYGNKNIDYVTITPDVSTGDLSAKIKMNNLDVTGADVEAKFGNEGGYNAQSAYLTDDLYAAQMGKYIHDNGSQETYGIGDQVAGGVIVSASLISDLPNQCTNCQFVNWGVWAGEAEHTLSGGNYGGALDVAHMVPYVAGEVTQDLYRPQIQNLGQVDYSGAMVGSVLDRNGVLTRHDGSFVAGIDLNNRTLTDFNADFAGNNFGFQGRNHVMPTGGDAVFTNIPVENLDITINGGAAGDISGTINGALFGPSAEDIGGNFDIHNHVSDVDANGIYLGTQQ